MNGPALRSLRSLSPNISVGSYQTFYFVREFWLVELVQEDQGGFSQRHVGDRKYVDCYQHSSNRVREVNSKGCDEDASEGYERRGRVFIEFLASSFRDVKLYLLATLRIWRA